MTKMIYTIGIIIGSYLASWIVTLFGASYFSLWSIFASGVGAFAGLYVAYKINTNYLGN